MNRAIDHEPRALGADLLTELDGCSRAEIEERLAAADLDGLADAAIERLAARVDDRELPRGLEVRLVVVEDRRVLERSVVLGTAGGAPEPPSVTIRWQGFAPLVQCENGDASVQAALALRRCEVEGDPEDQLALARALAARSDDPLAQVALFTGWSDRRLERRLRTFDREGLLQRVCEVGAEVAAELGSGREFGRTIVVQFELPVGRRVVVRQVVADGETTRVLVEPAPTPTITCRFARAIDLVRILTFETTPMDLVVGGGIQLDGDLSLFANLDLLRF